MTGPSATTPRGDGASGRDAAAGGAAVPPQPSPWNIANALTMLRIALVPVYGWLLLRDGGADAGLRWAATGVFVAAMATDRLDGDLARARGLVTDVGKVLDPIADKALTGMGFIGLSLLGVVAWWMTALVLVREIGITAMRFALIRHTVLPAGRGGKLKTTLQALALALLTVPAGGLWRLVGDVVLWLAVAVTLASGLDYVLQARRLARDAAQPREQR